MIIILIKKIEPFKFTPSLNPQYSIVRKVKSQPTKLKTAPKTMKWLLGIFLVAVSIGSLGLEFDPQDHHRLAFSGHPIILDELIPSVLDSEEANSRRTRSQTSHQIRLKSDRISDKVELPGSLFFCCRIWQSYIPVDADKSLKALIGHTIQVNAP